MKSVQLLIVSVLFLSNCVFAQQSILSQLENGEREAVEAIALYPAEEREYILEASTHPEVLVRMNYMQKESQKAFRNMLEDYSEDVQKKVVSLTPYPELLKAICSDGKKKSIGEMDKILADYPAEISENAFYLNRKHYSLLAEVNELQLKAHGDYNNLIEMYPRKTKEAFQALEKLPEVVITLNEYMGMTVLLGDIYKKDGDQLKRELDSLNVVLAEEKAKELNDWKKSLEEDPEAMAEYQKSAEEFAKSQGYDDAALSQQQTSTNVTNVYVNQVWRPYSYWFGPPWWYAYDYWYPYPWWYHCGYYYGPNNVIVFVGFPSYYYVHWHMYHHHHFYHYPHFTDHIVNHYYGHRGSLNPVTAVAKQWVSDNEKTFPSDWLENDGKRVDRIKEYGRFITNYDVTVSNSSSKPISPREYLEANKKEYPNLSPVLEDKKHPNYGKIEQEKPVQPTQIQKDPKPVKVEKDAQPVFQQPKEKIIKEPTKNEKIDRAKNYHYESWKRSNPPVNQPREVKTVPQNPPRTRPVQKQPVQPAKPVQKTPVKGQKRK